MCCISRVISWNINKRSLTLNLETKPACQMFKRAAATELPVAYYLSALGRSRTGDFSVEINLRIGVSLNCCGYSEFRRTHLSHRKWRAPSVKHSGSEYFKRKRARERETAVGEGKRETFSIRSRDKRSRRRRARPGFASGIVTLLKPPSLLLLSDRLEIVREFRNFLPRHPVRSRAKHSCG